MTRKIAFACLQPHLKGHPKETDIMEFPWEKEIQQKLTDADIQQKLAQIQETKLFYERYDSQKNKA